MSFGSKQADFRISSRPKAQAIKPVSYTHLDVYKRQAQVFEIIHGTPGLGAHLVVLQPLGHLVHALALAVELVGLEYEDGLRSGDTCLLYTSRMEKMEHDAFMDRARAAYAVVQTGETALYGNIILRKGVVRL